MINNEKNRLQQKQKYIIDDTVFWVEPIFKKNGNRTLLHSISKIVEIDLNKKSQKQPR